MNDWHNVLAVAVEDGWTKEVNDVALGLDLHVQPTKRAMKEESWEP